MWGESQKCERCLMFMAASDFFSPSRPAPNPVHLNRPAAILDSATGADLWAGETREAAQPDERKQTARTAELACVSEYADAGYIDCADYCLCGDTAGGVAA